MVGFGVDGHICHIVSYKGYIFLTSSALGATWRVWLGYTGSVPTATTTICATPATWWGGTVRSTLSSEWSPKCRQPGIGSVKGSIVVWSALFTRWSPCRVKMSCRVDAKRVEAKGVFVGAEVMRGPHWRFGDQDGKYQKFKQCSIKC